MGKFSGKDGKVRIGSAVNISAATYNTGVVTIDFAAAHGLVAGDRVLIENVAGMTDINGEWLVASAPDADTITISKTTAQTYTSGGTGQKVQSITGWNLTKVIAIKDVSDSGSTGGKDFIADGLYEVDGDFESFPGAGVNMLDSGDQVALTLSVDANVYWSGNAIILSMGEKLQVSGGEAVKAPYAFKGTGAWTRTDNS